MEPITFEEWFDLDNYLRDEARLTFEDRKALEITLDNMRWPK